MNLIKYKLLSNVIISKQTRKVIPSGTIVHKMNLVDKSDDSKWVVRCIKTDKRFVTNESNLKEI